MANSGGNKPFKRGTKKILCNIIKYCDQKAENEEEIVSRTQPMKRACQIAGISVSTIKRIHREAGDELYPDFISPEKRVKKSVSGKFFFSCFDKTVIFFHLLNVTFFLLSGTVKAGFSQKKPLKKGNFNLKKKCFFIILIALIRIFLLYGRTK